MKPMRGRWICCVALLLAAGLAGGAPVRKEGVLRYQFKEGETLRYTIVEKGVMESSGMKLEATVLLDMTWKVTKVDKNGKASITQTFDRIQMKGGTPVGGINYDSKSEKEPEDEISKIVAKALSVYSGAEVNLVIDSRGTIDSLKNSEKLAKALDKVPAELRPINKAFSEDSIRRMIGQCIPVLPERAPVKGAPWEAKLKARLDNIDLTVKSKYTADGQEMRGGQKAEKIVNKPTLELEIVPGSEEKIKVNKQEASGTGWINRVTGRLVEGTWSQKIEMEVTTNGETVTVHGSVTTTMKLVDKSK